MRVGSFLLERPREGSIAWNNYKGRVISSENSSWRAGLELRNAGGLDTARLFIATLPVRMLFSPSILIVVFSINGTRRSGLVLRQKEKMLTMMKNTDTTATICNKKRQE